MDLMSLDVAKIELLLKYGAFAVYGEQVEAETNFLDDDIDNILQNQAYGMDGPALFLGIPLCIMILTIPRATNPSLPTRKTVQETRIAIRREKRRRRRIPLLNSPS